jgi:dihydroorotate dehydrogenase electron transfer subunit
MPAPPSDARSLEGRVVCVRPSSGDGVILRIALEKRLPPLRAARFFMLRREDRLSPAIPRPFSIYREEGGELEFLIKVMGQGTRALADCVPGTKLRVIGPLGNGWPALEGGGAPWVMLAGGIGSAPFHMAIEQALAGMDGKRACKPSEIFYLYGAARADLLYELDAFQKLGVPVHTCTIDGSHGRKGHVLQLLGELQSAGKIPKKVRLLACGPEKMLEAVELHARKNSLECWLSLETLMGCGVGICNGCPVPTVPGGPMGSWPNAKCCVEGPVFSRQAITLCGAH